MKEQIEKMLKRNLKRKLAITTATLIAFLLDNVNFEVAVVTELVTFPSIPTEFLFFIFFYFYIF